MKTGVVRLDDLLLSNVWSHELLPTMSHRYCAPSHAILAIVKEVCSLYPDELQRREARIRSLAKATLERRGWNAPLPVENWRGAHITLSMVSSYIQGQVKCTHLENLFAASAYLGLGSLFDKLRRQGVTESTTFFGSPLTCAIYAGHGDIVWSLLQASPTARQSLFDITT